MLGNCFGVSGWLIMTSFNFCGCGTLKVILRFFGEFCLEPLGRRIVFRDLLDRVTAVLVAGLFLAYRKLTGVRF